ncbi:cupredoxin domain-containing protein [Streptomyces sp. 7R007]
MPRLTLVRALLAATAVFLFLPAPSARAATSHQVAMSGYAFSPRSLTVTAGDTVTWTNQDQAPHDVKTTSGPESLHSPMLDKGGSWSHTFTTPGTYSYVCTVHPGMTAQLVVKAAPVPTPTAHPTGHDHAAAAPTVVRSPRRTATSAAAKPTAHAEHGGAASAHASSAAPSPAPGTAAAARQPVETTASAARPLDPLLLLAGVVAGVAVLCLLLVGSRASTTVK